MQQGHHLRIVTRFFLPQKVGKTWQGVGAACDTAAPLCQLHQEHKAVLMQQDTMVVHQLRNAVSQDRADYFELDEGQCGIHPAISQ